MISMSSRRIVGILSGKPSHTEECPTWENVEVTAVVLLLLAATVDSSRGIEMYQQQQFAAAEQELRRVLAENPKDSAAQLYLIRALLQLERIPEALAHLEQVLAGNRDSELQFQAGRILRELAERRFAQLQAAAPGSAAVREFAGRRLEMNGDLAGALKEYKAAAAQDPHRPGIHYLIGNILWRMRETDAAAEELKLEIAATPHHGMANLRMGQVLASRNENESAIAYLERSLGAMSDSTEARRDLGKAYRNVGRIADARREWETLARANPNDDQVHYLLGNLYRESGEAALAKRELEKHRQILDRRRALATKN
jgi:tetratricopeptide (TPR) repeat protein